MEVSDDFKERYANQAAKCDIMFLLKALDLTNNCDINYKISNNKKAAPRTGRNENVRFECSPSGPDQKQ